MEDYDNERWRIISGKVGNGFSAAACKEKAGELDTEDIETAVRDEPANEGTPRQNLHQSDSRVTEAYDLSRHTEGS